jgi:undecaprenyl pyrophosphate synthase
MWALSKENIIERDPNEIAMIFALFEQKVPALIPKLQKAGIRMEII